MSMMDNNQSKGGTLGLTEPPKKECTDVPFDYLDGSEENEDYDEEDKWNIDYDYHNPLGQIVTRVAIGIAVVALLILFGLIMYFN